jgi:carbonic anhydrase
MGSLSEPPCTEGVLWIVMKQTMQASPAQMALFSRLYPLNARPAQSSYGRMVKESN